MALLLRRRRSGILSSVGQLAANKMMTTTAAGVSSGGSPWVMMEPEVTKYGTGFRFWCCAKERIHYYEVELGNWKKKVCRRGVREGLDFLKEKNLLVAKLVGSSQGWLAYRFNCCLYLVDPTSYRCIRLPDVLDFQKRNMNVRRIVLSPHNHDDERELGNKAFMICGVGSLAFCSRSRREGGEWSIFSERHVEYESVVYSTVDRRLLCLTHTMKLEGWDVAGESPRLDWALQLETPIFHHSLQGWLWNIRYLACSDQTGDLFMVIRFFKKNVDVDYKQIQYEDPTVYFEVYKIDRERGSMIKMEGSLEGLSIFVGMNDSVALKIQNQTPQEAPHEEEEAPHEEEEEEVVEEEIEEQVPSIRQDSVHFTYDERIGQNKYIGVFDYTTRVTYPLPSLSFPDEFCPAAHDIDISYPLWFTPAPGSSQGTIHDSTANEAADDMVDDVLSDQLQSTSISDVAAGSSKPKKGVKRLPGGKIKKKERQEVIIKMMTRNKRKCITTVKGLELFGVKLNDASKKLGNKFATGASVVKGRTEKEQIDVQGDLAYDIVEFITDTWPDVPETAIFFMEGRKKVPVKKVEAV